MGAGVDGRPRRLETVAGAVGAIVIIAGLLTSCDPQPLGEPPAPGNPPTRPNAGGATPTPPSPSPRDRRRAASMEKDGTVLLAWSPVGLPARTEGVLDRTAGVREATTVMVGLDWIRASEAGGTPVDRPPAGFAIPLETAVVEPREYAGFVPRPDRSEVVGLGRGEVLLAETEAGLRGAGRGLRLDLGARTVRASGVVSDLTTAAYEALAPAPAPEAWRAPRRFVLLRLQHPDLRASIRAAIIRILEPGAPLRIRARGETPFLRYGDAVMPQLLVKKAFGEFSARPREDGRVTLDPAWVSRNVRHRRVPLLGRLTCHRALFAQLEGGLGDLAADGLGHLVDASDQAGCWVPRFIGWDPGGWLSHHAWGIALDINVSRNPFGGSPQQDPRLVSRMEKWGFTWGGRWLIPDGMHFEWARWIRPRSIDP